MIRRGALIVVSGPSGVGKDTVLKAFMPGRKDLSLSISATTRTPRPGELDGAHYHFIAVDAFKNMIDEGEMLEYAEFAGNFYGTPKKWVEESLSQGLHVILEIELVGALKIRALMPEAVFVFLMPPSLSTLKDRLIGRGTETPASIDARMEAAKKEILQASAYDYIIVNNTLPDSCEKLGAVITAATLRAAHLKDIIQEVTRDA